MLAGKRVLITGASSGIGKHFAQVVANEGAESIVLAARRVERLDELAKGLSKQLGRNRHVIPVKMDVASVKGIRAGYDEIQKQLGRPVNVVINNAGVGTAGPIFDASEETYDTTMGTNLKGAFFVAQEGINRVRKGEKSAEGISVINIASIAGFRIMTGYGVYCISKAGVIQMTKAMALECAALPNYRVNAICPGFYKTEISEKFLDSEQGIKYALALPAKRIGKLHELDGPVLLLASDKSSFMNGSIISVDGAHSVNSL